MQREPPECPEHLHHDDIPSAPPSSSHHGLPQRHDSSDIERARFPPSARRSSCSASSRSVAGGRCEPLDAVDASQLDEKLCRLNRTASARVASPRSAAGQRVSDYENALTPPTPRQASGFKVIRRSGLSSNATRLTDFPNEILTHVLSHLHPDSHAAVALVSKRFYALVTTPHAWRMAFMRYFPGHTYLDCASAKGHADFWAGTMSDIVRFDIRYFGRLTLLATWRSEYLFRTRLIRSLARGKPGTSSGGIGSSGVAGRSVKRKSAVLTYHSKLPWLVTNIHAVFSNGTKPPRAIQGAGDLGVATMSDPTTGKVEKWGLQDFFSSAQWEEVVPRLVPYGLGDGPAATPNVMDVSQPYGVIAGQGFPGGRAYFRGINEGCGRYLGDGGGGGGGSDAAAVGAYSDVPKIPETADSICSVWIAKSSLVPASTHSMCGMLTGSALGVVTAYALGCDSTGSRFGNGDMTARWIVSAGVPIISLQVDDRYSIKRRSSSRVWAVALNALGEVFYLTQTPVATPTTTKTAPGRGNGHDVTRNAWLAGRTAYWHLVEPTRRAARPDERDKCTRGTCAPRSSSNDMELSGDELAAEARDIEKYLHYKPSHFRRACEGWDMQRRLEVDFAADDGRGAGESVFVIDCGLADGVPGRVRRFSRLLASALPFDSRLHDWDSDAFEPKGVAPTARLTSSCLDCSSSSLLTLDEDPLHTANDFVGDAATSGVSTASPTPSTSKPVPAAAAAAAAAAKVPGRRARLLAVGTDTGAVVVWNARDRPTQGSAHPVRVLQTDSPEIACLAASALYLVHGGSDGLVQAWDPLASTPEPIRTLNARSNGRVPRHMIPMNPSLRQGNHTAVGAIFLDPDPTVLRGVLSCGAFLRYWTYSSSGHPTGRKRRMRHADIHGRLASRRLGGTVSGHIAAEEAELRRESEARAREQAHLRRRFGVGALGDLTEEEALRYAQMVSEEAYLQDEQRRVSDSASSCSATTADTTTPEPSVSGTSPCRPVVRPNAAPTASTADPDEQESEFEQQMQRAIRLSLLEGAGDMGQSSRADADVSIKTTAKGSRNKTRGPPRPTHHTPAKMMLDDDGAFQTLGSTADDADFALALSLSMQEEGGLAAGVMGLDVPQDEFPPLETQGVGKGKGVTRW
ncbi:hypothetical protein E4U42_003036 [Claviceps africana]|uniref:F-box domain-containing protein n=1 Tax=Claviceps africana TaxID=83212 RepID=A0A8K0J7V6_9HYPO|nr:hypothetical protein E4U42_003036 [Claviceps africana]